MSVNFSFPHIGDGVIVGVLLGVGINVAVEVMDGICDGVMVDVFVGREVRKAVGEGDSVGDCAAGMMKTTIAAPSATMALMFARFESVVVPIHFF